MISVLIFTHATLGGTALVSGLISMLVKKGNNTHKRSGLVFFYSMTLCALSAMTISVLPNHVNPFLFSIGIFSLYFVLTGKRALNFKKQKNNLRIDRLISISMIFTGILMILLPIITMRSINIVLLVFAVIGISFSIRDLILFSKPQKLKNGWLKLHLGKMVGAYISASTAFVVVNELLPSFYGWFIPGIIGSIIITYWLRKVSYNIP
ncbi:DUF2306 domain-containing protein [Tenacibaculum xiamenense]|uniref:DUF2306 domain-containing protein n=1 Tax=Tenacibaculum xiamenense TaxID=1261553 RepID=UPI003894BA27